MMASRRAVNRTRGQAKPDIRVVCVDNDPTVITHARALLAGEGVGVAAVALASPGRLSLRAALLAAIPSTDAARRHGQYRPAVAPGEPGNPMSPPSGCLFHPRCVRATDICRTTAPHLAAHTGGRLAAWPHATILSVVPAMPPLMMAGRRKAEQLRFAPTSSAPQ
jgi:oligopeptide/dipeptide ABC transporter ATP-binding protein